MTSSHENGGDSRDRATIKTDDVAHAARSGAVQVLTIAAQALLTITHVLLARLFGRAVFGSYQASLALLEMLTRAGTGGGMLRYIAGHRARGETELVRSALGTGLKLCLIIATVSGTLLAALATPLSRIFHEPAMEAGLRLMAPAALFTGLTWALVQASLAMKVTRANLIVRGLGEPVILFAAGLTAALFGRALLHLALAHVTAAALTCVLAIAVVGRVFGKGELRRSLRAPWLPGFVSFSIPLGVAELMNAILQRADIVLLTMFVGANAAAVYAASEFITRVIANARYVFDSVAAPVFSEAIHLNQMDRLRQNLVTMTRWVASAAAPIAVTILVLRREILSLYGPGFQDGATAVVVLAMGHLVNSTLGLSGWILVASGRSRLILINNVVAAVVNVTLGLTLIPRLGLLGTAIAALGSLVFLQTVMLIEVRWIHGVYPFGWPMVKPFAAAVATFAVEALIARQDLRGAIRLPLVIGAGLVTYLTALRALGLDADDRRLVGGAMAKLRRKFRRAAP